jgi:hypothetical protein
MLLQVPRNPKSRLPAYLQGASSNFGMRALKAANPPSCMPTTTAQPCGPLSPDVLIDDSCVVTSS